jgi:pimeloyl-ACP methyl ester carboxylesterase
VLVLPGFTADDRSTAPLRWFLRGQGYWTHGWDLGQNMGPTRRVVQGIESRLLELHERHGRAVTVVGWSLGGIYARTLARKHPEQVRQVITLGSPFRMIEGDHSAAEGLWKMVERRVPLDERNDLYLPEDERPPLTIPTTAIYSRTDGVVRWYMCIDRAGPLRENIEVRGSHNGLGWNPAALVAIADRLAQPEGVWRPFRPPFGTAHLYPRAETYRAA